MENDDSSDSSYKNVRNVEIDAHCTDSAVVVKYDIDFFSSTDTENSRCPPRSRRAQKIIRLKDLNKDSEVSALAKYVIKCCPFIAERRKPELEQILYYLQKRQNFGNLELSQEGEVANFPVPSKSPNMRDIEVYVEKLYDEIEEKIEGTARIFQLSNNVMNVKDLFENETLVGALTRVLRDDWKKSYDIAVNIVSIFHNFSLYSDFHPVLAQYKIGTLCLHLIDSEIKRWDASRDETYNVIERSTLKKNMSLHKQHDLVAVCFNLLMNLADDIKVELKMVNRNLIAMLAKCIADRNASLKLLIVATTFLLKLSLFVENRQTMTDAHVLEGLCSLFPTQSQSLRLVAFRLLFNLSFDASACNQMVAAGLVSHVACYIDRDEHSLNLLYQLSMNDDAKAVIAYTDVIQTLMRRLVKGNACGVSKALLLNIALEKRNAQLICGSDGTGLDLIATAAFANHDHILVKLMRNIAFHSGPSQIFFTKWARSLLENAIQESENGNVNLGYAIDCLGSVNLLNCLQWDDLAEELRLLPWIQRVISHDREPRFPPDFVLQVIILCGTMARQLNVARSLSSMIDQFIDLLSAQQEDDEMVLQIVYLFYILITHEELYELLTGDGTQIGAYLLDLMHDRNLPIRSLCDAALTAIAERSEDWARKMDIERFRWHNAHWLEMVADGNTVLSRDSTVSGSPDLFNIFGAEELLGEQEANDFNTANGQNF